MNRLEQASDNLLAWSSDQPPSSVGSVVRRHRRNRRRTRGALIAAAAGPLALGGALLAAGRGDDPSSVGSDPGPQVTEPTPSSSEAPTTAPPTTTTTATSVPTTQAPTTTATSAPEPPTTTTRKAELPVFPPENTDLVHGGTTWAVVLAGSAVYEDPALADAEAAAEQAGYSTGPTDCDQGAAEALGGPDSGVYTVSVYLHSRADAQRALDRFNAQGFRGGVVAEVKTFCLD